MIQIYKRTWCEYLTPCKIRPEIMIGEYYCQEKCPFFKSIKEEKWKGQVECYDKKT